MDPSSNMTFYIKICSVFFIYFNLVNISYCFGKVNTNTKVDKAEKYFLWKSKLNSVVTPQLKFNQTPQSIDNNTFIEEYPFPEDFQFGAGTSCYQSEGAWRADGKGYNIWDFTTHNRSYMIKDHSTGDVADDSYYKYMEDLQTASEIGFNFYRFSLSWSRILPTGLDNDVNDKGIEYYNNVINEVLNNGLTPLVTIHHFDLPLPFVELGGWTNSVMVDYFVNYCRVVFKNFGNRVKYWVTINEPTFVAMGYGTSIFPPAIDYHGVGEYLAGHNMLKAHAKAYQMYNNEFRGLQNGVVSITLHAYYAYPKNNNSVADIVAVQRKLQFYLGWFAHPIYSLEGDYPSIMKQVIYENSMAEGYSSSRLPSFTEEEISEIKGSSDFFSVNHFTSHLVTPGYYGQDPSWVRDSGVILSSNPSWPSSASSWLKVVPQGMRGILNWIKDEYNNPVVIVTENGYSDNGTLYDIDRINYFKSYMIEMLKAIYLDNCNVKAYLLWGMLDDFEWTDGYIPKFGINHVDFNSPERTRTRKESVKFFEILIRTGMVPQEW